MKHARGCSAGWLCVVVVIAILLNFLVWTWEPDAWFGNPTVATTLWITLRTGVALASVFIILDIALFHRVSSIYAPVIKSKKILSSPTRFHFLRAIFLVLVALTATVGTLVTGYWVLIQLEVLAVANQGKLIAYCISQVILIGGFIVPLWIRSFQSIGALMRLQAAKRLVGLGGSMPDMQDVPRRREEPQRERSGHELIREEPK